MTVSRNHWPWAELSPPAGPDLGQRIQGQTSRWSPAARPLRSLASNAPGPAPLTRYGGPAARPAGRRGQWPHSLPPMISVLWSAG
eukprot:691660-Hanusia_phi.AAC.1